jgi:trk system potassium uptake protein TrkH
MFRDFRERVNLRLYNSKSYVLKVFRFLHVIVALAMLGVLTYYYGFPQSEKTAAVLLKSIEYSFLFYIINFLVKIIYDYNPREYIRQNKLEFLIIFLLIVEGIAHNLFGSMLSIRFFNWIGLESFADVSNVIIQFFFVIYIVIELLKKRNFRLRFKLHPGLLFVISIFSIVAFGTLLLSLPEMTVSGIGFTDAFFTAMSATSETGLLTIDASLDLTFKGQLVVLFLIQVGGLNTIAFAALYFLLAKFGIGLKQHDLLEDYMNKNSFADADKVFYKIVKWTLAIELIGFVLIFIALGGSGAFEDTGNRMYYSLFHAISGFNSAGISIFTDGMMSELVIDNYLFQLIILGLFFLGSFGMLVLFDLIEVKSLRDRMRNPWKSLQFTTKITLNFTLLLLFFGAVIFFIFEYNNTMEGKSAVGQVITALFQSMTTRSAGFNVVDTGSLTMPVLIIFLFLMFVGGGSGSTAGGIRVTTFAIMIASVLATIRGKKFVELYQRTISNDLVSKAYSIFTFFIVGNLIGIFLLSISEMEALSSGKFTLLDIIFEHVSASCTVGLSTGITSELSTFGKYIITIAMFIGRVGTLTLAYLLGRQAYNTNYKYPSGHTMIG